MAEFNDSNNQYDWRAVLAESGDLPEPTEEDKRLNPNAEAEFSDAVFQGEEDSQFISGMGIEESEEDTTNLNDILQNINKDNTAQAKADAERLAKEEEERKKADEQARQEALAKIWKEQHEEEQKQKAIREAEEAAEAERLAREEEERKQANPLRKLAGIIPKPKEKTPEELEAERIAKEERAQKLAEEKAKKAEEKKLAKEQEKIKPSKKETEKPPKQEKEKKGLFGGKKEQKETPVTAPVKSAENDKTDYKYLATHDELTHLKNKRAYDEDLATLKPKNTVIMFFDVNNLKMANDTLGHAAGNKLIMATAEELSKLYPENTYRVGGDEFIVLLQGKGTYLEIDKKLKEDIAKFNISMKKRTAENDEGLIYAVSVGYAIGDGKKSKEDIQAEADQNMYANKQAYKKAHPKEDARAPKEEDISKKPQKEYDELLPEESRQLKATVKENHMQVSELNTEKILREIQSKADDIYAILITDKNFDVLFIVQDVEYFLNLMTHGGVDYSYLYVIYQGGAQYYGADEYYAEITALFENLAKLITSSGSVSQKDLLKVKGINIFKKIYVG